MIVFFDTSVLLKLYVEESGSQTARELVHSGVDMAVSSITYTETHSGVARRMREGSINRRDGIELLRNFEADWFSFGKVPVDESICRKAGKLCLKHSIRSLDALQLACALLVRESQEEPLIFLTADTRLETAARQEKLRTKI